MVREDIASEHGAGRIVREGEFDKSKVDVGEREETTSAGEASISGNAASGFDVDAGSFEHGTAKGKPVGWIGNVRWD